MSSRPLVEQWSERSGVVCIAAWALPCVRSPSWKMNNDIRLSSSHPVVPFKTLMLARSVCVCAAAPFTPIVGTLEVNRDTDTDGEEETESNATQRDRETARSS